MKMLVFIIILIFLDFANSKKQSRIVNPHDFTYHLNNPAICSKDTDILIWIHSAPKNLRNRIAQRETWANPVNWKKYKTALVFFLGKATAEEQLSIEYESETYQDIVQESYVDSYRNLTYKAISGCKWTSIYCKSAELILKVDDDMLVDSYAAYRDSAGTRSNEN